MNGMDGFTAAKKIARMENPPLVVFVTNSDQYTTLGYGVVFNYLIKPVSFDKLSEIINAVKAEITPKKITIEADGHSYVLQKKDILYVETFGHHQIIHTINPNMRELKPRMKLSEIEASLTDCAFVKPHKSFIVNLEYVDSVENNALNLTNNIKIPLSRRRKLEFEQALNRFVWRHR
jgi:DNA-binding LytR/AlgR family response regulator